MTEWIKCSERLPKSDEIVLVFTRDRETYVAIWNKIWRDSDRHDWNIRCDCVDAEGNSGFEVTHWMPLPDPPHDCEKSGHFHKGTIVDDIYEWHCDYCDAHIVRAEIKKSPT
jgi:hypothetical protein